MLQTLDTIKNIFIWTNDKRYVTISKSQKYKTRYKFMKKYDYLIVGSEIGRASCRERV